MAREFDIPLRLVTPHMKGQKVKDAQWLLAGNNRFKDIATYKDGKIDGDYGPLTAQATRRAKYWLGYTEKGIDTSFGQAMYEYLRPEHWRQLPHDFRVRRDQRLKTKAITPGLKAYKLAEREVGYHESPPGSNDNKYGREYGFNRVAWCVIFYSIMMKHAGYPSFHYAAVESVYYDAINNRNRLHIVRTPQTGDFVGYTIHGDPFAHGAFFGHKINGSTFEDLGGNTGPSSISAGGMVMKQTRPFSMVHFFARYG